MVFVPYANGQSNFKSDSLAILKVLYQQQDHWNEADIESFMGGYWPSEELVFVGAEGPTYGYEPVKLNYYKRYPDKTNMGTLAFTVIQLSRIDQASALLVGRYHLTLTTGNSQGYFTLVWRKINGNWLIVSDHTTAGKSSD
ncbi:MAG: nuclear transport factor 2 family protein [Saprospiraceae bacterium]|nr:nuclear transport factor 2 family protein [Saprospiraceae bacterium]